MCPVGKPEDRHQVCKVACTEISEEMAMNAHVRVSALSGDWNQSAEGMRMMRLTKKKKKNLMWTFRETVMAFEMREISFTFMLPRIVMKFFLNNQPDALITPILFRYKTLHVSGIFSVHHQEFPTVHSALVSFRESWWNAVGVPSWRTLLGSSHQNPAWNLPVPNVQ
jgi:hypothetical protein